MITISIKEIRFLQKIGFLDFALKSGEKKLQNRFKSSYKLRPANSQLIIHHSPFTINKGHKSDYFYLEIDKCIHL